MNGRLIAALLLLPMLAGCATQTAEPATGLPTIPIPVRIVMVGDHPDIDRAALLTDLPTASRSSLHAQSLATGALEWVPYQNRADWRVTDAPAAFADALFAYIASIAEPEQPTSWLASYDCSSGNMRLHDSCSAPRPLDLLAADPRPVMRVDGAAVDAWIAAHRFAHGLSFEPHAATVFILDHHTSGALDNATTYYQYKFNDGTNLSTTKTMRAWGGHHDFVFFDRSAAPSSFDIQPWRVSGEDDGGRNGRADPPIWDLDDTGRATENLRLHLADFYFLRAARENLYAPHALNRIDVRVHFIIDEAATLNPNNPASLFLANGGPDLFNATDIEAAFGTLAPWIEWNVELVTINLPNDDPALAQAFRESKVEGGGGFTFFSLPRMQAFFRENLDTYAPPITDGRTYPVAFFVTDAQSSVNPLGMGGGVAMGNERGASLVAYAAFADAAACPTRTDHVICFFDDLSDDASAFYTNFVTHEAGHNLALRHPHDREGEEVVAAYRTNSLWDSTLTAMTYRHYGADFDVFDQRYYATHTAAMRLAANPDHPVAGDVRALLEAGRVVEAAHRSVAMPVVFDPHDRPETTDVISTVTATLGGPGDDGVLAFTVPEGATWARASIAGSGGPLGSAYIEGPNGTFGHDSANHYDVHALGLEAGATYTLHLNANPGRYDATVTFHGNEQ